MLMESLQLLKACQKRINFKVQTNLHIYFQNNNGLRSKLNILKLSVAARNFAIIILVETKLRPDIDVALLLVGKDN